MEEETERKRQKYIDAKSKEGNRDTVKWKKS
jgi:hypothetical protein